jgi:hypothetical protein
MDSRRIEVWAGRAGLLIGLALAAVAVAGWTMPTGVRPEGVRLTLTAAPTGELSVTPLWRVLRSGPMRPGDSAMGTWVITNLTGESRRVQLRTVAPSHDLDDDVDVLATSTEAELLAGRLGSTHAWGRAVDMPPGSRIRVRVRLTVPAGASGYENRAADLRLELRSEASR